MSTAIGIDLGTTFTCAAYVRRDGTVCVVDNDHSNLITPSVVHYGPDVTEVGESAVSRRGADPRNTVYQVKRLMGRMADDEEIQSRDYKYEIISSDRDGASVRVQPKKGSREQRVFCPEQISADIIRHVKEAAEKSINHRVTEAVITVPAHFNNSQRQATKDAGELAGLKVLRIITEPTAAALAYAADSLNKNERKNVLVYDLGGGTFDVSIVEMLGADATVKSTKGETFLGGEDFDVRLYEYAAAAFHRKDVPVPENRAFALLQSCERAKRTLSTHTAAQIETFANGQRYTTPVARADFERLCNDLFKKTIDCVKDAIKESKLPMKSIDDVVLVGGSSRIPRVQQLLREVFSEKDLKFDIQPDHAVAHGAAILADHLAQSGGAPIRSSRRSTVLNLRDVTPHSLGVEIVNDTLSVLIPRNTPYPTSRTKNFTNVAPSDSLIFPIYEGENAVATKNNKLGKLDISVRRRPKGENKMKTTFTFNADGILDIVVIDEDTGSVAKKTVRTSQLTEAEKQSMQANAEKRKKEEEVERGKRTARVQMNDALSQVEMAADDSIGIKKEALRKLHNDEQKWMQTGDPSKAELNKHTEHLLSALRDLKI